MRGRIITIHPHIDEQKLKVKATLHTDQVGPLQAFMPDRELSALVPRTILLAGKKQAPPQLISTIEAMLKRMAVGRSVRIWKYGDYFYFSFISWREVRFGEENNN
jgi:hypothetical protein